MLEASGVPGGGVESENQAQTSFNRSFLSPCWAPFCGKTSAFRWLCVCVWPLSISRKSLAGLDAYAGDERDIHAKWESMISWRVGFMFKHLQSPGTDLSFFLNSFSLVLTSLFFPSALTSTKSPDRSHPPGPRRHRTPLKPSSRCHPEPPVSFSSPFFCPVAEGSGPALQAGRRRDEGA